MPAIPASNHDAWRRPANPLAFVIPVQVAGKTHELAFCGFLKPTWSLNSQELPHEHCLEGPKQINKQVKRVSGFTGETSEPQQQGSFL